jgi:hypothetical protein
MLSKGGKISHRCSSCKSTRIVNTKKGLGIQSVEAYVNIPANHFYCLDCFGHGKWSSRLKVNDLSDDNFDGIMTIDAWERCVTHMDKIVHLRHVRSFYSDTPEIDSSKSNFGGEEPTIKPGELTQIGVQWSPDGKEDYSNWTHRPNDFGIWVGYNSWRFKDPYDVMLKDGTIHRQCSPNGSSFFGPKGLQISEYDVIALRLCTFNDLKDHWLSGGETEAESNQFRGSRNASMFGCGEGVVMADWAHVIPALFDVDTKELVHVKENWSFDTRFPNDITMARAHEMFDSEEARANLKETVQVQMTDEELMEQYMPMAYIGTDAMSITLTDEGLTTEFFSHVNESPFYVPTVEDK